MGNILIRLAFLIIRIVSWLPTKWVRVIGTVFGILGYYVARERRNVGLVNLTLCFPEMSEDEKKQIIKDHFKYLVISGLEYGLIFYGTKQKINKYVHLKNVHYFNEYYLKKPIVLLAPHFVGLDIAAIRLGQEVAGYSMYSRQKNKYLDKKLKEGRLRFTQENGSEIFARQEGLGRIIRRLRKTKRFFYYLPDQDFGERESMYVPFFAHKTCATLNVLPKLIKLTDAVVIPSSVYRDNDHYVLEFFPAWENYPTDNLEADIIKMNHFIEERIKKNIAQYFWLHKRFKTQPDGRHKLYQNC